VEGEGVTLRDYVDVRCDELARRLDESASDSEHIREGIGNRVSRTEFDLMARRVELLERLLARLFGGLTVVALVIGVVVALSRYVVG